MLFYHCSALTGINDTFGTSQLSVMWALMVCAFMSKFTFIILFNKTVHPIHRSVGELAQVKRNFSDITELKHLQQVCSKQVTLPVGVTTLNEDEVEEYHTWLFESSYLQGKTFMGTIPDLATTFPSNYIFDSGSRAGRLNRVCTLRFFVGPFLR